MNIIEQIWFYVKNIGIMLIIFSIVILIISFLFGDLKIVSNHQSIHNQKYFSVDTMKKCISADYKIDRITLNQLKDMGIKPKKIQVYKESNYCYANLVLKKPKRILGTDVYILPLIECDMNCLNYYDYSRCCSTGFNII